MADKLFHLDYLPGLATPFPVLGVLIRNLDGVYACFL